MPEPPGLDPLPQATVEPPKRTRFSVIWIIPILAAVVAIGIAIQRIVTEGPTITVVFKSAEGIEAGKTFVKYKDVTIGHVTKVELADDYGKVEVTAKISKRAARLMVEDARFWVVEPRVTLSGISGLGTLLSGNYVGFQPGKSDKRQTRFTAIEVPPIITDQPGRRFVLKANTLGSLGIGSPIYYRQLQAGQVAAYDLAADGKGIDITVFINTPYEKYVTRETRFWNASGIDVSVGAGGVNVRTEGLVSLLAGGLAFDAPSFAAKADPAAANAVFILYGDRATAMKQPDSVARFYALNFTESVLGLSVGAPVTLLGLPAGEVTEVGLRLNPATMAFRPRVLITFYPERLIARMSAQDQAAGRVMTEGSAQVRLQLLRRIVEERGLRAQLRSGNLLTGQLYVALDYFPDAPKPKVDWTQDPLEIPVVPSTLPDLEAKLSGILAKLDNLPLESIGKELQKDLTSLGQTLEDTSKLLSRVDTELVGVLTTTLNETRLAIASADRMLTNTDATLVGKNAPVQQDLRDALQEMVLAARSLRVLADYLERHPESLLRGKTQEKK
jgi:paraquat-inducible protein B